MNKETGDDFFFFFGFNDWLEKNRVLLWTQFVYPLYRDTVRDSLKAKEPRRPEFPLDYITI